MKKNKTKKICSAPWTSLAINADKSFSLCCNTLSEINLGNWNEQSILETFKSKSLQDYRNKFKNYSFEKACISCYSQEDSKLVSKRDDFINNYKVNLLKETFCYSDIKRLEIFLNNTCNYSCRTCGSFLSSSWNSDNIALKRSTHSFSSPTKEQILELITISKGLDSLYFAGGEPLLCEETYLILDSLLKHNNDCLVTINTNLSRLTLKRFNIIDYIPSLNNLNFNISLDGIYKKGEYIRNGQNFNNFIENLETLAKTNVKVTFLITISILNILDIEEIIKFIVLVQPIKNFNIDINFVNDPAHYNVQILPNPIKSIIQASLYSSILNFKSSPVLNRYSNKILSICTFLKKCNSDSNIEEFLVETISIDKVRKQSFKDIFPNTYSLLNNSKIKRPL